MQISARKLGRDFHAKIMWAKQYGLVPKKRPAVVSAAASPAASAAASRGNGTSAAPEKKVRTGKNSDEKKKNRWCGKSSASQLVTGCAIDSHSFFPEDVARFAGLMVYCFDTEDAATAASNFIKGGKPDAVEGQR